MLELEEVNFLESSMLVYNLPLQLSCDTLGPTLVYNLPEPWSAQEG